MGLLPTHTACMTLTRTPALHSLALAGLVIGSLVLTGCASSSDTAPMPQPESMMAAQYSMPFTASLAFYADLADPDCYEGNVVSDPKVLGTARQIYAHLDKEIDGYPRYAARLKATTKDGRTVAVDAWDHRGTEQKPFTHDDVVSKFRMTTAKVLSDTEAQRIIDSVAALRSGSDAVEKLCRALRRES